MREIVTLHVGNCGIRIGEALYYRLIQEHALTAEGAMLPVDEERTPTSLQTYFTEVGKRWVPRAVHVEMGERASSSLMSGSLSGLFDPDSIYAGNLSSYDTFASCYHNSEAQPIRELAIEALRRQLEHCDSIECVQVTHSACGGSGSGLHSRLL